MDLRKLQKTKGGSFLITLPKTWISKFKLREGSVLSVEESEQGYLLIKPHHVEREIETKPLTIPVEAHVSIERGIRSAYLMGAEFMKVESSGRLPSNVRESVLSTIQRLIGLEIVEETSNSITIQSLLQLSAIPIKATLKRAHAIVYNMHRDVLIALEELDYELAQAIVKRDDEVDRLYFLLVRQLRAASQDPLLASKLGVKTIDCLDLRLAAKFIEAIGDCVVKVAEGVLNLCRNSYKHTDVIEDVKSLGLFSMNLHGKAVEALVKLDSRTAEELSLSVSKLNDALKSLNEKLCSNLSPYAMIMHSIALYFYQIGGYGIDLAELVT